MLSMQIGRDYKGTVTGMAFDGNPAPSGVTVAWSLYDAAGVLLGSGSGTYVSSGLYSYTIPASTFAAQGPAAGTTHRRGRVYATAVSGGVSGSWGDDVAFEWPQPAAG